MSCTWSAGFLPAMSNPFATEFVEQVPFRFACGNWDQQLARLAALRFRAAITGPKGTGKTTLLEQLAGRLESRFPGTTVGSVCFDQAADDHQALLSHWLGKKRHGTVLLVDGMERLSMTRRCRLLASRRDPRGGLIVTSHRRCRLPVWIRCQGNAAVLQHVLDQLNVQLDAGLWSEACDQLQHRHGDIRSVLRYLYDQYATGHYPAPRPSTGS